MMTKLQFDKVSWTSVKFGDVVSEVRNTVKSGEKENIERYIGLEHIDSENIHITKWGYVKNGTTFTRKFDEGQILFGRRRAYLKKAGLATFTGLCSGDIIVMEAKEKLLPELLPFLINNNHFFDFAVDTSAGSLSPRTKFKHLAEYQFLLPPKDQQAKIAKLLWAMDDVVEKEKFIFNSIQIIYKRVLFDFFVGEKIHPKRELGEFVTIKSGESPSKFEYNSENIGIPFLKVKDLNETVKLQEFSKEWVTPLKNRIIPKNSVIFPKRGAAIMTNKVRITICDCHVDTNIMALTITENDKLDTEFLFYFLLYKKLFKIADTSQIPQINNVHINPFPIYLPPIKKQQDLVQELNNFINLMEITEKTVLSSQQLQKSLINEIFSV